MSDPKAPIPDLSALLRQLFDAAVTQGQNHRDRRWRGGRRF
jgi:hypothetical protein